MFYLKLKFLLLFGTLQVCHGDKNQSADVFQSIFEDYNPSIIPNCGLNASTQVKVGIAFRQILDLDEPSQILRSNIWLRLSWTDCRLQWNATSSGIPSLIVPYKHIWIPDITLYDNAENDLGGIEDYRASVYPDGTVYYYFPSVVATLCKMDVTYFPFDTQTCPLKLGSWSYFANDLNLTGRDGETSADISAYKENGEWEIVGAPAVRHETYYSCCPHPFPDVTFYVTLKRRPRFYLLNLMFPCILMSSMAVLGFLLPPDSGEKVSLEITVLLSLSVFMLVVSETMPPTSETFPYIGMYFTCAMLLVSWSCLMTVTVLNLHHRGGNGHRMPSWVRTVFLSWLGGILFGKCLEDEESKSKVFFKRNKVDASDIFSDETELTDIASNMSTDDAKLCKLFVSPTIPRRHSSTKDYRRKSVIAEDELCGHFDSPTVPSGNAFAKNFRKRPITAEDERSVELRLMKHQLECIESIYGYLDRQKQCGEVAEEWQQLARVLDRVVMIMFFTFQLIATLVIMLKIMGEH